MFQDHQNRKALLLRAVWIGIPATLVIFMALVGMQSERFRKAYAEQLQQLHNDEWLRTQCEDAVFAARMRRYGICEQLAPAWWPRQPVLLLALMETCVPASPTTALAVVAGLILAITPSVLLPMYRAHRDHVDKMNMIRACSPQLRCWRPKYA